MTVTDRQQQQAHALVDRPVARVVAPQDRPALNALQELIHIRPGLEKRTHDIDVALARGEEYRREPGLELRVQVGAGFEQGSDDRGVSFGRGPHEGRLLALFTRVGIGALG